MKAPTDSQRLDALAGALNRIVLYEGKCRVEWKSFPKKIGISPALLRKFADGLLQHSRRSTATPEESKDVTNQ